MSFRAASAWLFLTSVSAAFAQPQAPASLIDELIANAAVYRATLPSITADEAIESETSFMGLLPDRTRAQGTFRVLRAEGDERLKESRQLVTVNGKPVDPAKHVRLPFTLFGGFGSFQEMFFTPAHRVCFDFRQLPDPGPGGTLQIAVSSQPSERWPAPCPDAFRMVTGLVRIDPTTHQITHFERTVSPAAPRSDLAPFASVDLAPAKVGDDTFWLPTTVVGSTISGKIHAHFTAHYSNYHRYAASIKLLPGATEVEPTPPNPVPPVSTPH